MPEHRNAIKGSVCFFNTNSDWGGGEKWSLTVAKEIYKSGHNVIMLANKGSELFRRSAGEGLNTEGLNIKTTSFLNPFIMLRIRKIYRTNNVRVVFLNLSIDLKTGGVMARFSGVPKIIYRRGMARPVRGSRLNRYLLTRVATGIIANSEDTKQGILKNFAGILDPGKISVIYNGVELPRMKQEGRKGNKLIIGSAGRVSSEKGYISLVSLGRLLEGRGTDFEIILAGEGDQLSHIRDIVSQAGLGSRFRFPGFIKDMDQFYRTIDVLVLTSEKEGLANVLLESMSYGKPAIAFDIGSPSELIINGMNGFIVEKNNIEAMAEKISELYNNPEILDSIGKNARETIISGFTLESHIEKIEQIIE
ncbi:MAG: glycosyltransferase family 4 protein [Bacteroidales bacterium]|nr:glycosyltransferase family 4 protein [Bacteroidales bacterium]